MSARRLTTAFSMTAKEFLRRRGMLALMIAVPVAGFVLIYFALPRAPASIQAVEGGVTVSVETDQVELFGGVSSLVYVGLLASVTGLYLMQSALKGDRRLLLAGYLAGELVTARAAFLVLMDLALTIFLVGLLMFFATPRQLPAYVLAVFWASVIYSFYGGLIATLIRSELAGIIAVLFLANIDVGYLEIPGYSTVLDEWWARLLPGYFPVQLAIDAAFTGFSDLLWSSFWSIPHALVIGGIMLALYDRATHIHAFMPERPPRRLFWATVAAAVLVVLAGGALLAYRYYSSRPPVVGADGRISAPEGKVVSLFSGRVRTLLIAEGDDVKQDQVVAWVEDSIGGRPLPVSAPLSGRVTSLSVRRGENVIQGSVLATIRQTDRLEVILEVEETSIGQVAVGQGVELRFAVLEKPVRATVTEIALEPMPPEVGATEAQRRIRKYQVTVRLSDPDPRLRLGMAVRGRIFL
jgi:ABC-2 type transport system permease protein